MEKTAIKSQMASARRLAARSPSEAGGSQASPLGRDTAAPSAEAGDVDGSDATGSPGNCRVTVGSTAGLAECRVGFWAPREPSDAFSESRKAKFSENISAGPADRQSPRGAAAHRAPACHLSRPRRGARQAASAAGRRELRKRQGAYLAADGTVTVRSARAPRLSRGESLIYAQDLQSATQSNISSTYRKIFGFVMT